MSILSIQSAVAYGHVGNSAAVFPLQRAGFEVWPVYTVNFSNHTGYGDWRGPALLASDVSEIITGIGERGAFPFIDTIISGYLGGPDIGASITEAVAKIKEANPQALYACDPVMGSAQSGCFVNEAIPPMMRETMLPAADIITPNQFELGFLTGVEASDTASTLEAATAAHEMGPSVVLVTSVRRPDAADDTIEMIASDEQGAWIVQTPLLPKKWSGSGDVTTALFAAHYSATRSTPKALARTVSSVYDLLRTTYELGPLVPGGNKAGAGELRLIEAQDYFAEPQLQFQVSRLR